MYYEQLFQTTEAKMNFVKGLIHISKADGVISPEEQTFFIDAARGLGIPEDDIAVLPAVMTQTEEIPLTFASRQEALCFLREALQLCMVDNDYSESEQKEIMKLAKEFGVEPERVYALEKWVQDLCFNGYSYFLSFWCCSNKRNIGSAGWWRVKCRWPWNGRRSGGVDRIESCTASYGRGNPF